MQGCPAIIYADDDDQVRSALTMAMESRGLVVHSCRNGQEAIDLCRRIRPAAMLLDLDMPVLDGYETARRVRADPDIRSMRLIAISGSCDQYSGARTQAAGFDRLLSKPVQLDTLLRALEGTD